MWCDLGKSVWSWTCDIFSFLFDWSSHLERYILLKTPPELTRGSKVISNQRILKTIEKKSNSFLFWVYLTINTPNFWLIPLVRNTHVDVENADSISCKNDVLVSLNTFSHPQSIHFFVFYWFETYVSMMVHLKKWLPTRFVGWVTFMFHIFHVEIWNILHVGIWNIFSC